ncbi:unnamed protein product [Trichogramma brassicae]|uniref:Mutator-like transposase domain-containing protein n=1 Tax=Trichogramma brassicae TaxID=86971 RepID=A0A6H5HS59_9HYME|nr:unnamed protein product [Trichogramma brassicae]
MYTKMEFAHPPKGNPRRSQRLCMRLLQEDIYNKKDFVNPPEGSPRGSQRLHGQWTLIISAQREMKDGSANAHMLANRSTFNFGFSLGRKSSPSPNSDLVRRASHTGRYSCTYIVTSRRKSSPSPNSDLVRRASHPGRYSCDYILTSRRKSSPSPNSDLVRRASHTGRYSCNYIVTSRRKSSPSPNSDLVRRSSEPPRTIFVQLHRDFPQKVIAEPEFRPRASSEPPGTIYVRKHCDFLEKVIAEPRFDLVGQAGLQDSTRSIRYMYSVGESKGSAYFQTFFKESRKTWFNDLDIHRKAYKPHNCLAFAQVTGPEGQGKTLYQCTVYQWIRTGGTPVGKNPPRDSGACRYSSRRIPFSEKSENVLDRNRTYDPLSGDVSETSMLPTDPSTAPMQVSILQRIFLPYSHRSCCLLPDLVPLCVVCSDFGFSNDFRHATLVGYYSGKVLSYAVRSKKCRLCQLGHSKEDHNCRMNHTGSAKSMEQNMAVELFTKYDKLKKQNFEMNVIIGDDDMPPISNAAMSSSSGPSDASCTSGSTSSQQQHQQQQQQITTVKPNNKPNPTCHSTPANFYPSMTILILSLLSVDRAQRQRSHVSQEAETVYTTLSNYDFALYLEYSFLLVIAPLLTEKLLSFKSRGKAEVGLSRRQPEANLPAALGQSHPTASRPLQPSSGTDHNGLAYYVHRELGRFLLSNSGRSRLRLLLYNSSADAIKDYIGGSNTLAALKITYSRKCTRLPPVKLKAVYSSLGITRVSDDLSEYTTMNTHSVEYVNAATELRSLLLQGLITQLERFDDSFSSHHGLLQSALATLTEFRELEFPDAVVLGSSCHEENWDHDGVCRWCGLKGSLPSASLRPPVDNFGRVLCAFIDLLISPSTHAETRAVMEDTLEKSVNF